MQSFERATVAVSNETAETDRKLNVLLAYEVVFAYRSFRKLVLAANELSDNETEHSSRDRQRNSSSGIEVIRRSQPAAAHENINCRRASQPDDEYIDCIAPTD